MKSKSIKPIIPIEGVMDAVTNEAVITWVDSMVEVTAVETSQVNR
jgi:hypothetical protein